MTKPTVAGRRAATETEWTRVRGRVAQSLPALEPGFFLVLETRDDDPYFVRVQSRGSDGLLAEAASAALLPEWKRLGDWGDERLAALGWNPPREQPEPASPAWWRAFAPGEEDELARLAVATLREVFDVAHPHSLVYRASDAAGDVILLPGLGLPRRPAPAPLGERVTEALRHILQVETLERDADGDWPLNIGDGVVYVRAMEREGVVAVFGPVLLGLSPSPQLLAAVNEINAKIHGARAWFTGDAIAVASEFVDTADLEGLRPALDNVVALAHGIGEDFRAAFGGHRLGEPDPPTPDPAPEPGTGMYL